MYAYNCDVYCDGCAELTKNELDSAGIEDTGDTNDYPQYAQNDESDHPQHCAECDEFLENALTSDGYDYVARVIQPDRHGGRKDSIACTVWAPYYGIETENPNTGCLEGVACPQCNQWDEILVEVKAFAIVTDDGPEGDLDCDFDVDSYCKCRKCGFEGKVRDFK
jgi:hypothetical protein